MPKKKPSKKSDQPELPLDAVAPVPLEKDEAQNTKDNGTSVSSGENGGLAVDAQQNAAVETAPTRQPGEKVQDEGCFCARVAMVISRTFSVSA